MSRALRTRIRIIRWSAVAFPASCGWLAIQGYSSLHFTKSVAMFELAIAVLTCHSLNFVAYRLERR